MFLPLYDNHQILIHHLGDETVTDDFPNGNSKSHNSNFTRTAPSVLKQLTITADLPSNVYKEVVAEKHDETSNLLPDEQPTKTPYSRARYSTLIFKSLCIN